MLNKIGQILSIIFAALVVTLATILLSKDNNLNLWLDASNFVESDASKKFNNNNDLMNKNPYENSFLADGYSNYSLYQYNQGNYDIKTSRFNGNIDSYDNVTNDAMRIKLWKNDFSVLQLVIKTKKEFTPDMKLNIEINKNDNNDLSIESGFLRYVSGSHNPSNTDIGFNPGTTKPLLVPDAITNDQYIPMYGQNVYIYRIRIDRSADEFSLPKESNIDINIKNSQNENVDKKRIYVDRFDKKLTSVDQETNTSFNVFSNPNVLAGFYNKKYFEKYGKWPIEDLNEKVDLNSTVQYVDWNWEKYWKYEYSRHFKNYGEGSLFVADLLRDDESNTKKWIVNNNSDPDDVTYEKTGVWSNVNKDNSWFIFKMKDGKLFANWNDWAPFDDYVYKMRSIGYKNLLLGDIMYWSGWEPKWFYSWNDTKKAWELVSKSILEDGIGEKLVDVWIKHIADLTNGNTPTGYKYNWIKDDPISDVNEKGKLNAFFYFDEANVFNSNGVFKSIRNSKYKDYSQYLKIYFAIHIEQQVKDYKWISILKDVDVLYLDNQTMFNIGNKKIEELINYRNEHNKVTGQYQLDSHSEYDLLRAEPGSLVYEMLILNKKHEPNYMKYMMNAWSSMNNYQSAEYYSYADGDASWEYLSIDSIDKLMKDDFISSNQSVRLEQLAIGVNFVKKVNILGIDKEINKYITPLFVGSRIQSKYKFNFENKFNIETYEAMGTSYIVSYLEQLNSSCGEIDVVRKIGSLI